MRRRHFLILTFVSALLPGCALLPKFLRKKKPEAEGPKTPQWIGTIVLVNSESGFVLVDSGSQPSPVMGKTARTQPTGGTAAELRVTEVSRRPFVIADIVNGTPQKGDQVFQDR